MIHNGDNGGEGDGAALRRCSRLCTIADREESDGHGVSSGSGAPGPGSLVAPRYGPSSERTCTIGTLLKNRQDALERFRKSGDVSALVVGAGINGAAVFRELALHDVDAVLIDRGDFACGATAAPSRMIHAGLRYLELGDYALVREGVHERNLLLQNCPHCVFPLPTTIPLQSRLDGLWGVIRKALHLGKGKRALRRGAWMVKLGLLLYDRYARHNRQMPRHRFTSRADALKRRPGLHPKTILTATYYDAWVSYPERLCLEAILDAEAACERAHALNYVSLQSASGDTVALRDELTGEDLHLRPKAVVNAAGAWIDSANRCLGHETRLIAGTKGGHLVLENAELFRALDGEMLFYETPDGRAVLAMPWLGKTLVGSTDIRVDDPDAARCDDGEIDYMLGCVAHLFPNIEVNRSHILSTFSGVRPLRAADAATTGQISRAHCCHVAPPTESARFPVLSMVGGKWTPFRAFGEQVMDKLLDHFHMARKASTESLPIGGGRDFPRTAEARQRWLRRLAETTALPKERLEALLFRYGTRAEQVARFCAEQPDRPLQHHATYTAREIEFIVRNERVLHLDDLVLRRTAIALLGELRGGLLDELLAILACLHEWPQDRTAAERRRAVEILRSRHRIGLS